MPLILSLNELSCRSTLRPAEVDARVEGLVTALVSVRRLRPDASLLTIEKLPDIELAAGYPMSRWAANQRNVDRWRLLRRMQDRSPFQFSDVAPDLGDDEHEYRHGEELALGLGVAHRLDGLAMSLAVDERWDRRAVELTRIWLAEEDETVIVRHVSTPGHVEEFQAWLARGDIDQIATGAELWAARNSLYPDLSFLPRVERDLNDLQVRFLPAVRVRLLEIQEAIREWDPSDTVSPRWHSRVTPEHEGRRALCHFEDLDGEQRLFDLHARFTPGPMRLHFRWVAAERMARIAYIGRKLGI